MDLAQLSKKQQTRFFNQLVQWLQRYTTRAADWRRFVISFPEISDQVQLYFIDQHLVCEFKIENSPHSAVRIIIDLKGLFDESIDGNRDLQQRLNHSLIQNIAFRCETCSGFCVHVAAAIHHFHGKIVSANTDEAMTWMSERLVSPETFGAQLVESIQLQQETSEKQPDAELCRVVWRVSEPESNQFQVKLVLQKPRARNGWTSGKQVRNTIEDLPNSAYDDPSDRAMLLIFPAYLSRHGGIAPVGLAGIQVCELLSKCPHVVWDQPGFPPAQFIRAQVSVGFREDIDDDGNLTYFPELIVDGVNLSDCRLFAIGNQSMGGMLVDSDEHTVRYFTLTAAQTHLANELKTAQIRGARLNRENAETLSKLLSQGSAQQRFKLEIPESLAGPDVLLPPQVELQLEPRDKLGMEARLRVSCRELEDAPTPGIGPERILVHTPAGVFHLVRDVSAEASTADTVANSLGMGDFQYNGPYSWQLNNLDESLSLIERVRGLGDAAPTVCWPKSKPLRLISEITPQSLRIKLSSERDWFGIDGQLTLDGLQVPLAELMVAIRGGSRYVPLGDNQFATISEELRARLSVIDDLATPESNGLRLPRAAAPLIDEAVGLDIPAQRDERWRQAIDRLNDLTQRPPAPPQTLNAELREYQVAGYQWLSKLSQWGLGGCLADDMGLGKTVQALGVLLDRATQGAALIVAPTSVGINWVREVQRFAPSLQPHLYRDHDRDHLIQNAGAGQLVIISYQMLQRDIERISSRPWATLVLDEAQYIKNFQTKTNQAVRRLEVDWCVALSGTPLENHLGELWSLLRVLSPGLLGSWERFRHRFGEPIERDKNSERLRALAHVVRPFILRRTKQEVLKELPPRTEVVLTAELSPAERKRYDAARMAALADLTAKGTDENEQQKRIRVLAWLTRLRQLSCHPALVDSRWERSSAKLDLFLETVHELRENHHRALVFSQFVQHLSLVRAALDKARISYQYLDGSTPTHKRQEAVDNFQLGEGELFLISLKAGGTGLNLTAADYVLHLDPWWNPAVEDQATDRAHRIGQTRPVTVYRLVAKDTIEEQILSMHEDKRELLAGVLDGADRAAKMSTQELVELIRDTSQLNG